MTAPAYTGTELGAPTAGPVDPNAPMRIKAYTILTALLGLIPVLTIFKVVTTDQGVAIGNAVQALVGLAGSFGFAFVASKTAKQVKNGTFDPAPQLPAVTALEQMKILRDQSAREVEHAVSSVQAGADTMQAVASAAARALGVPSGAVGAANAGFDAVQELIARAGHKADQDRAARQNS